MSVLKGEGKVEILFGSTSIAVGSRVHRGYLSRPDLAGEWPTMIVVTPVAGVTSSVKDVCRRLARRGLAVVAPAVSPRDTDRHLGDIVAFITNPAGFWSSAEHGFGVLGIGAGGSAAIAAAVAHRAAALALVSSPFADEDIAGLASFGGPALALHGRADEVPVAAATAARDALPRLELVIYGDAGPDLLDDHGPGYDDAIAGDAVERLSAFFATHLPSAPR